MRVRSLARAEALASDFFVSSHYFSHTTPCMGRCFVRDVQTFGRDGFSGRFVEASEQRGGVETISDTTR